MYITMLQNICAKSKKSDVETKFTFGVKAFVDVLTRLSAIGVKLFLLPSPLVVKRKPTEGLGQNIIF